MARMLHQVTGDIITIFLNRYSFTHVYGGKTYFLNRDCELFFIADVLLRHLIL